MFSNAAAKAAKSTSPKIGAFGDFPEEAFAPVADNPTVGVILPMLRDIWSKARELSGTVAAIHAIESGRAPADDVLTGGDSPESAVFARALEEQRKIVARVAQLRRAAIEAHNNAALQLVGDSSDVTKRYKELAAQFATVSGTISLVAAGTDFVAPTFPSTAVATGRAKAAQSGYAFGMVRPRFQTVTVDGVAIPALAGSEYPNLDAAGKAIGGSKTSFIQLFNVASGGISDWWHFAPVGEGVKTFRFDANGHEVVVTSRPPKTAESAATEGTATA